MRAIMGLLTMALLAFTLPADALDGRQPTPAQGRNSIYGGEMMTPLEQDAYRRKMWELKTEAERDRFRREHHERMRERARDLGVHLPEDPVYLDRPYFDRSGEKDGVKKTPMEDSLRRWPAAQNGGKPSLRRWNEEPQETWRGRDKGDNGPEEGIPDRRSDPRWPPPRKPVIRPEPQEKETPPRVIPGAGMMNR